MTYYTQTFFIQWATSKIDKKNWDQKFDLTLWPDHVLLHTFLSKLSDIIKMNLTQFNCEFLSYHFWLESNAFGILVIQTVALKHLIIIHLQHLNLIFSILYLKLQLWYGYQHRHTLVLARTQQCNFGTLYLPVLEPLIYNILVSELTFCLILIMQMSEHHHGKLARGKESEQKPFNQPLNKKKSDQSTLMFFLYIFFFYTSVRN